MQPVIPPIMHVSLLGRTLVISLLLLLPGCSGSRLGGAWRAPRLVVVVVVDQMRSDYLTRFADQYSGGLSRLSRDGVVFVEARHDHAITLTAPGHATLATGTYPGKHGIVSNSWWSSDFSRTVYAVEDTVSVIDAPEVPGSSAALLLREPLGSWLKQANPASKVFSVSLKDRSAILMAGSNADAAYWMAGGRFVSSSSYLEHYPDWVTRFNASSVIDSYFTQGWHRLYDEAAYGASREDDFPAEADGVHTTFPHLFEGDVPGPAYYDGLSATPFADELTFSFAGMLLEEERLGDDAATDLLMISVSAADGIGHAYGPYSQEVQDYYLRLDRMLESMLTQLDGAVGAHNYLLVLTSDHGVMPMPEEMLRRGTAAGRVDMPGLVRSAAETVRQRLSLDELPVGVADGVVLRIPRGAVPDSSLAVLRRALADELMLHDAVADVFTRDELIDRRTKDRPFLQAFRNSYHTDRSPDLYVLYKEYYLATESPTGTSHGSPYPYDADVPLIFLHAAFPPMHVDRPVRTVDLAPTLAALMRIGAPDDLDGRPIPEVLRAAREGPPLP